MKLDQNAINNMSTMSGTVSRSVIRAATSMRRIERRLNDSTEPDVDAAVTDSNTEARREQETERKPEAVLLRIDDPFCEREFTLVRTSKNRYTLRFSQVYVYKEDRARIPQVRGLKSGAEVWEALVGMVASLGAYELTDDHVEDVAANVATIDSVLAEEVRRAASEWFST